MIDSHKRLDLIKATAILILIGVLYYIFINLTGLSFPCVFHEITGLKCPGCGATHMMTHLARLEFFEAFESNPLLFFMFPFLAVIFLIKLIFMPKWLDSKSLIYNVVMIFCCAAAIVFGVVRNLPMINI